MEGEARTGQACGRQLRCLHSTLIWLAGSLVVVAVFGRLAAHNLGNYRPLSNDEGELMSVGYKLATQGVLGSDLFAGFFGADRHYLLTLPLQAVLQALTFRVFGAGVLQARLVSLLAAIALVWTVGWVAFRWYGVATALLTEVLLVGWQSSSVTRTCSGPGHRSRILLLPSVCMCIAVGLVALLRVQVIS